jgi:hypothetical protein
MSGFEIRVAGSYELGEKNCTLNRVSVSISEVVALEGKVGLCNQSFLR